MLRAVNGNRDGGLSIGTKGPGVELWSFMAPEFFPNIKGCANTPPVSFFGATFMTDPAPKPYGFDGPITAYRTPMTFGCTRACAAVSRDHAFDDQPGGSVLKCRPDADSLDNLGQTWSTCSHGATGHEGVALMLIMGGGYDPCEDTSAYAPPRPPATGSMCRCGPARRSRRHGRAVIADVFVVTDSTGLTVCYGRPGQQCYRINIGSAAPSGPLPRSRRWLAAGTCSPNRKFMFAPSIVESGGKYVLMLGSAIEKPDGLHHGGQCLQLFLHAADDPYDPNGSRPSRTPRWSERSA
jgi:type IV pilus assembly protein PilY1